MTMGYLHVRGVFSTEEMVAANAEVDWLATLAVPGDQTSWWARDESNHDVLCRLVYASLRSDVLAPLRPTNGSLGSAP